MSFSVLIADDHSLVCFAMKHILDLEQDFRCVAACSTLSSAQQVLDQERVDVTVCDLQFENGNALQFLQSNIEQQKTKFVISTSHRREIFGPICSKMGIDAFLTKNCAPTELVDAVREVAKGPSVPRDTDTQPASNSNDLACGLNDLSPREWEVLRFLGEGASTKAIANSMFLSVKTVESHRASIKRKLKIDSKDLLVSFAAEVTGVGL